MVDTCPVINGLVFKCHLNAGLKTSDFQWQGMWLRLPFQWTENSYKLQWGLEYQTGSEFGWSKAFSLVNVWDFDPPRFAYLCDSIWNGHKFRITSHLSNYKTQDIIKITNIASNIIILDSF